MQKCKELLGTGASKEGDQKRESPGALCTTILESMPALETPPFPAQCFHSLLSALIKCLFSPFFVFGSVVTGSSVLCLTLGTTQIPEQLAHSTDSPYIV